MSMLLKLARKFQNSLIKRPLITNIINGGFLAFAGDGIAQMVIEDNVKYDPKRGFRFLIFGSFLMFFICVQLVNFYVLPLHYRVFWVQSAALIWQTYYSYITQKKRAEK
ncbi:hypothetical protein WR25_17673 [Diploscapter pachys]|uniref:Mitochondrial inner membrane protein Mpv17 n=1 Tax=Diploscapter pachys TaxID=2018661 RepID=A0A2A2KBG7_9BILA|nr:hypothetical protein WR25_17673 [Diploscapter pachys]